MEKDSYNVKFIALYYANDNRIIIGNMANAYNKHCHLHLGIDVYRTYRSCANGQLVGPQQPKGATDE